MDPLSADFIAVHQANVQTRVDYAVAKKMLDAQEASGEAAIEMIRAAGETQAQALRSGPGSSGTAGLGECVDCQG